MYFECLSMSSIYIYIYIVNNIQNIEKSIINIELYTQCKRFYISINKISYNQL